MSANGVFLTGGILLLLKVRQLLKCRIELCAADQAEEDMRMLEGSKGGTPTLAPDSLVYLDHNATTPVCREAILAMQEVMWGPCWGNPSSKHPVGVQAKHQVERSRSRVASALGVSPEEILFTSGGTESNNLAIKGALRVSKASSPEDYRSMHIVTTSTEHPATLEVCRHLEGLGAEVIYLPVDGDGHISMDDFQKALSPYTTLVSVMHANNEVGAINPIAEMVKLTREHAPGALFHTDSAQSMGKIPANPRDLGVDLLSICSHKFYGPKGVGALYMRQGVELDNILHGAGHEKGLRPGTENIILVTGMSMALASAIENLDRNARHMRSMRDLLLTRLRARLGPTNIHINGRDDLKDVLPNTLNASICFEGKWAASSEVLSKVYQTLACSAGSACHAAQDHKVTLSPVLEAMGVPFNRAISALRLSTGKGSTAEDMDFAACEVARGARLAIQSPNLPPPVPEGK